MSDVSVGPKEVHTSAFDANDKTVFGFWLYLMTDLVLFATLFATYAVLRNNTFGGPSGKELFDLPFVLLETVILLTSSFICGLALMGVQLRKKAMVLTCLGITFMLGATFLGLELYEFGKLISEGHSWQASGFLTAFFTLVGTHGAHIAVGLLWMLVLGIFIFKRGLISTNTKRLTLFSMFWHFLDVVWIFIFTIVYLMGAV